MLSKRLSDLKAALAHRSTSTPASANAFSSSHSTLPSKPARPTPDTGNLPEGHGSDKTTLVWNARRPTGPSSEYSELSHQHVLGDAHSIRSDEENIPPPEAQSYRKPANLARNKVQHTPPPPLDDFDINMAEGNFEDEGDEIVPPSTPPREITPPVALRRSTQAKPISKKAALAELQDVPINAFFSSPQHATPHGPPRAEASFARSDPGGPGPSSSAAAQRVQAQKAVKVDVQYPWSKEVSQKLRQIFKLPRFRTHQKEAIDETMAGKDGGSYASSSQLPI